MTIFIFFSHSREDYGTEYEKLCLEKIMSDFPDATIINPRDIEKGIGVEDRRKGFWKVEEHFFREIDKCDTLICAKCWNDISWRGRYTPGVHAEIEYAKRKGKKILEFSS